jgi:hypothetical protein
MAILCWAAKNSLRGTIIMVLNIAHLPWVMLGQVSLEVRHSIFSFRGGFQSTACSPWPVPHLTRTPIAAVPQRAAGDP